MIQFFEKKYREDNTSYYALKKENHIHESFADSLISSDDWIISSCYYEKGYQVCEYILNKLEDSGEVKGLIEFLENLEAGEFSECYSPDYTSDLTEWLNLDNRNVYYLSEALDMGVKDGFELLSIAYNMWQEEVFNLVVQAIIKTLQVEVLD